jgi:hypothetical protein
MAADVKTSVLLQHRVLSRLTYGPTATSVADLAKRGLASWVTDQLNPKKTESTKLTQMLSQFRTSCLGSSLSRWAFSATNKKGSNA